MVTNYLKLKGAVALGWLLLIVVLLGQKAIAQPPPLPATFYGTVTLDGVDAPVGTPIQALVNGVVVAQTQVFRFEGRSVYVLDVPGDDADTQQTEGGADGSLVLFRVGNAVAQSAGVWRDAATTALDLSATSPACTSTAAGDVNCDCRVNVVDLLLLARTQGIQVGDPGYDALYDLNLDGRITSADVARAADNWRGRCPVASE